MTRKCSSRIILAAACAIVTVGLAKFSHAESSGCGTEQTPTEAKRGEPVFDTGKRYPISIILRPGITRTVEQYFAGETKYLRVLLKGDARLSESKWRLTVRDKGFRTIQVFDASDFENSTTLWTTRIPGELAYFVFEAEDKSLRIRISEYIAMPKALKNTYYSALDPENPRFVDLYPLSGGASFESFADKTLGDSVGLLLTSYGEQAWTCSGVVVGEDLFLTNWHCGAPKPLNDDDAWLQEICNSSLIDLSWDNDDVSRDYRCVEPIVKSKELDFALLKLMPLRDAGLPKPAAINTTRKDSLESVKIIHHPAGLPKQISTDCDLLSLTYESPMADEPNEYDFQHSCDTGKGSSGAPVFDSAGSLIGLHHLGFMQNEERTACDNANKAVWIDEIVNFIKDKNSMAAQKLNFSN